MRLSLGYSLIMIQTLECPCCRMHGLGTGDHDAERVQAAIVGKASGYRCCAKCDATTHALGNRAEGQHERKCNGN